MPFGPYGMRRVAFTSDIAPALSAWPSGNLIADCALYFLGEPTIRFAGAGRLLRPGSTSSPDGFWPWLFDLDPEVFPIYLGLPWGVAIGPWPNIPWPAQIHTRICQPIVFERYGYEASRDQTYVQACYNQVVETMQRELDDLIKDSD